MPDREKVIKGLYEAVRIINDHVPVRYVGYAEQACWDALALLREQEPRVMTLDEWREWKNNPKRNPICELWEHDTSPMWVLNPDTIHEPALLMGKLKLFTGKPTFEQCRAVKWDD